MKYMYQNISKVQNDPTALLIPFLAAYKIAGFSHFFFQIIAKRFDLRYAAAAAQDEPVGYYRFVLYIHGPDILRLFIIQGFADGHGFCLCISFFHLCVLLFFWLMGLLFQRFHGPQAGGMQGLMVCINIAEIVPKCKHHGHIQLFQVSGV